MAKATPSNTSAPKGAGTIRIDLDTYDECTLQLEYVNSLLATIAIQTGEVEDGEGVTNKTMGIALYGLAMVVGDIRGKLTAARQGGAA